MQDREDRLLVDSVCFGLGAAGARPAGGGVDVGVVQVYMTIAGRREADELAANAVESRLAASSRVSGSVTSRYWSEGDVECVEEWLITFITTTSLVASLVDHLCQVRPWVDRGEIVAVPVIAGPARYLEWVAAEAW